MIIDGEEVNLPRCYKCNCELTTRNCIFKSKRTKQICKECSSKTKPYKLFFNENGVLNRPCRDCKCDLTLENTYIINKKNMGICKPCYIKRINKWNNNLKEQDPIKFAAMKRNSHLKKNYRLTLSQYNTLLEQQNGVCAICGGVNSSGRNLGVDHDHKNGNVRELLCNRCNLLISYCDDNVEILQKCINYLIKHMDFEKEFSFQHD